jgi:sugar O-acyltransferase (sialic acid O-acetyltransferase NeuD family)
MSKQELILIGAGGHAMACIDAIEQQGTYSIVGLIGLDEEANTVSCGYRVVGTDAKLSEMRQLYANAHIAIGQIKTAVLRKTLFEKLVKIGFNMPVIVSPFAYVSKHANIGPGSIVMHGAIVNAGAQIGENCIVNSRALIEHDCSIANHCHIATGAIINGGVTINESSFIGSGSVVKQGVNIGVGCLVGMGLSLRHDLVDSDRFVKAQAI